MPERFSLRCVALTFFACVVTSAAVGVVAAVDGTAATSAHEPTDADVIVYGGTSGGIAAAVAAARQGCTVVLIESSRHLGGLTTSGLGATDIGRQESIGGISREFYQRIKQHYAAVSAWRHGRPEDFSSDQHDPQADVMFFFEPHVAESLFGEMLREANVAVVFQERLDLRAGVSKQGARIVSLTMESGRTFRGRAFIDATYEGDLMAGAGDSRVQAYRIPYDAILPQPDQCTNLLVPVCLSATHVAYGSLRMEPVFMILGHSAGVAASQAIEQQTAVQHIDRGMLRERLQHQRQVLESPSAEK